MDTTTEMVSQRGRSSHVTPLEAPSSAYLTVVASAIHAAVHLDDIAKAQALGSDCVTVALRLIQNLSALAPEVSAAPGSSDTWRAAIEREALGFAEREAEFQQMLASVAAPGSDFRKVDIPRIESYLRKHPMGGPGVKVIDARNLVGGATKQTIKVEQQGAANLPAEFVIRQDWMAKQQAWAKAMCSSVMTEFEVLKHVFDLGLPVPQPLFVEDGDEGLGAPFLAVTLMTGRQEGDMFSPPPSRKLALQLSEYLGKLHAAPIDAVKTAAQLTTRNTSPEQIREELAKYRAAIEKYDNPPLTIKIAMEWLDANIPDGTRPIILMHGDCTFHNIMIEGENITALLDWERSQLGCAEMDLGYMKSAIKKMVDWDEFLAVYAASGGKPVDQATLNFYTLLSSMWLYSSAMQVRAAVTAGQMRDIKTVLFCAHYVPVLLRRISSELGEILSSKTL